MNITQKPYLGYAAMSNVFIEKVKDKENILFQLYDILEVAKLQRQYKV